MILVVLHLFKPFCGNLGRLSASKIFDCPVWCCTMAGMDTKAVLIAFGLTLFAGLSTGIGSALAFFAKRTNTRLLSVSLGFSAGVMIYVSFVDIFVKARACLINKLGDVGGIY